MTNCPSMYTGGEWHIIGSCELEEGHPGEHRCLVTWSTEDELKE